MFLDETKFGFADGLAFGDGFKPIPGGGGGGAIPMEFIIGITSAGQTYGIESEAPTGSFTYNNYDVDWGDGSTTTGHTGGTLTHVYATIGNYTIKITGDIYLKNTLTYGPMMKTFIAWGSGRITGITEAFSNCTNCQYQATDSPQFDFSNTDPTFTQPIRVFGRCGTTSLNVSNWNTSLFTGDATECFAQMPNINSLNFSNWDFTNVTGTFGYQQMCNTSGSGMVGIDFVANNVTWGGANFENMFLNSYFKTFEAQNWTLLANNTIMRGVFRQMFNPNAQKDSVDLSGWSGTDKIVNMENFCFGNRLFKNLNLTGWDITNVTTMLSAFNSALDLEEIKGLNGLRASSLTNIKQAFRYTYKLVFTNDNFHPDFGNGWSCTDYESTFERNGYGLTNVVDRGPMPECQTWPSTLVTTVFRMFRRANYVNGQFAPTYKLTNCVNMSQMFVNSEGIVEIDFGDVEVDSTTTTMASFAESTAMAGNSDLTKVTLGAKCEFTGCTTWQNALRNNTALTQVIVISNLANQTNFSGMTNALGMIQNCPLTVASYDALLVQIDNTNTQTGVTLSANLCQYSLGSTAETARTNLVTPTASGGQGWTIIDNGGV